MEHSLPDLTDINTLAMVAATVLDIWIIEHWKTKGLLGRRLSKAWWKKMPLIVGFLICIPVTIAINGTACPWSVTLAGAFTRGMIVGFSSMGGFDLFLDRGKKRDVDKDQNATQ